MNDDLLLLSLVAILLVVYAGLLAVFDCQLNRLRDLAGFAFGNRIVQCSHLLLVFCLFLLLTCTLCLLQLLRHNYVALFGIVDLG